MSVYVSYRWPKFVVLSGATVQLHLSMMLPVLGGCCSPSFMIWCGFIWLASYLCGLHLKNYFEGLKTHYARHPLPLMMVKYKSVTGKILRKLYSDAERAMNMYNKRLWNVRSEGNKSLLRRDLQNNSKMFNLFTLERNYFTWGFAHMFMCCATRATRK